ncbi:MAG: acyl carrier protein [Halioglobus sp.]
MHSIRGDIALNTDIQSEVVSILQSTLGLPDGSISADPSTRILGAIPEMDSMSVVGVLTSMEERYGITIDDDEVDADVFATVGSLSEFLVSKLV